MVAVGAWTGMEIPVWGVWAALALGSLGWVVLGELGALDPGRHLNALLPVRCSAAGHGLPVL